MLLEFTLQRASKTRRGGNSGSGIPGHSQTILLATANQGDGKAE